jgi:hypothetical protein
LARIFLPHIGELLAAHDRETARQALLELNLALQLHFREHGTFPESLDALIGPDFETLPLDPFDTGGPMHYRREPDGTAVVWSIGPDETDNGGRVEWRDRNGTGDILVRLVPPGERGASAP